MPQFSTYGHTQKRRRSLYLVGLVIALVWIFTSRQAKVGPAGRPPALGKGWPGWDHISTMFVFGDSYSQTWFNISGVQPSEDNPHGNEDMFLSHIYYKYFCRPNWVHFVTTTYNATAMKTYNFALGGAVLDRDLSDLSIANPSVRGQVLGRFLPFYSKPPARMYWTPEKSLFVVFCGINDIMLFINHLGQYPLDSIFATYLELLELLYSADARNFLIINVPPVERSPSWNGRPIEETYPALKELIPEFNDRVAKVRTEFERAHPDVSTFLFDINSAFNRILDSPSSYSQTSELQNTTAYCFSYEVGTTEMDTYEELCGVPVNQYFWQSIQHPTYPVFNATAQVIVEDCFSPGGKKGFCS